MVSILKELSVWLRRKATPQETFQQHSKQHVLHIFLLLIRSTLFFSILLCTTWGFINTEFPCPLTSSRIWWVGDRSQWGQAIYLPWFPPWWFAQNWLCPLTEDLSSCQEALSSSCSYSLGVLELSSPLAPSSLEVVRVSCGCSLQGASFSLVNFPSPYPYFSTRSLN